MAENAVVEPSECEGIVKKYAPEILELVQRASVAFKEMSFSFSKLKVITKLGTEVYQLVDAMQDAIVKPEMTEEQKATAKVSFGKDLVYFIYLTINPLKSRFRWLPFKKTIERKLVLWLAEMGLETAMKLFDSVKDKIVAPMDAEGKAITIRVL